MKIVFENPRTNEISAELDVFWAQIIYDFLRVCFDEGGDEIEIAQQTRNGDWDVGGKIFSDIIFS